MDTPLLERDAELEALSAAVCRAVEGRGVCVVVEGPPGTGKTRLLEAVRSLAAEAGATVLGARGVPAGRSLPFSLALALFEEPVARDPSADEVFAGSAALARPLLGGMLPPPEIDPAASRPAIVHGLARVAANLARRGPLILAVDDAHFADAATLDVITELAVAFDSPPCTIVLATRPPVPGAVEPALHRLRASRWSQVLTLSPLSESAAATALRWWGADPDEDRAALLHGATGGNPLLLRALATDLAGAAGHRGAAARIEAGATPTVRRTVDAWLAGLPAAAQRLARFLAVAGGAADPALACAVGGLGFDDLMAATAALTQAGILAPGGELQIACPLLGRVLYASLPAAERAALHSGTAGALTDRRAELAALAPHLAAAPRAANDQTVAVLREAAAAAIDAGEAVTAVAWLRRALEEPPAPETVGEVLVELGRAEAAVDPAAAAGHLAEAAAADPARRAELLHDAAHALRLDGRLVEAKSAFEEARRILPDDDGEFALRLEAGLLAVDRHDRRCRIDQDAVGTFLDRLRHGEEFPKPLLAELAFNGALAGIDANQVRLLARQALDGEVQGPGPENTTLFAAAAALAFTDDLDEAEQHLDDALRSATGCGAALAAATARYRRGQTRFRQGRLAEAMADLELALAATPDGWRVHVAGAAGSLAIVRLHLGDLPGARKALAALPHEDGWHRLQPFVLHAEAQIRLAEGNPPGAVEIYERMLQVEADAVGPLNPAVLPWRSSAAFALSLVDRRVDAKPLADEDFELATSFGTPRAVGVALRSLAFSRTDDERIMLLRRSLEVLQASPAVLEQAWTALSLGRALRAAGHRQDAVEVLRASQDLAMRSSALNLAQQVLADLAAAGIRPRRLAVTGPASLTPGEHRCAELAAAGRTNREIADELFVSPKAVEWHLGNAYRKLQIAGRGELASALGAGTDDAAELGEGLERSA